MNQNGTILSIFFINSLFFTCKSLVNKKLDLHSLWGWFTVGLCGRTPVPYGPTDIRYAKSYILIQKMESDILWHEFCTIPDSVKKVQIDVLIQEIDGNDMYL